MSMPTIRHIRALTVHGGAADYHDQGEGHWIDDHIAKPMARYPEYRQSRQSFGINLLGSLVIEIEASDGSVGLAVTTGGEIGAFIVERHLARFIEGQRVPISRRKWVSSAASCRSSTGRPSARKACAAISRRLPKCVTGSARISG